jgi:hypothetical protein
MANRKNPAAVALGRLGGLKGGPARMASMSEEERREFAASGGRVGGAARASALTKAERSAIAKKAAAKRWAKLNAKKAAAKKGAK